MNKARNKYIKYGLIIGLTLAFSLALGFVFDDHLMLGSITLFLGMVQTFLLAEGKWWEELIGLSEAMLVALIAYKANLYGTVIFTLIAYVPLSVFSLVNWKKNQYGGVVSINKMTAKKSVLLVTVLCASIALFSFLLSLLPNQNLPVLDTISNMLDICGIILIAFRYKEGWVFWILCSGVDLVMWSVLLSEQASNNAIMMIIISAVYVLINAWGFWSFIRMRHKQEKKLPQ